MKKRFIFLFKLSILAASLQGCAVNEPRPDPSQPTLAERQAANQPNNPIARRAAEDFIGMKGITPDQRARLITIYLSTYDQALKIQKEITTSKIKLFDVISSTSYSSGTVETLKQKIVDLDQTRLVIMFKALADVQDVVGYGKDKEPLYKHFYDFEHPRNDNQSSTK